MCISFIKEVRKRPWKGNNGGKGAGKYASPQAKGVRPLLETIVKKIPPGIYICRQQEKG